MRTKVRTALRNDPRVRHLFATNCSLPVRGGVRFATDARATSCGRMRTNEHQNAHTPPYPPRGAGAFGCPARLREKRVCARLFVCSLRMSAEANVGKWISRDCGEVGNSYCASRYYQGETAGDARGNGRATNDTFFWVSDFQATGRARGQMAYQRSPRGTVAALGRPVAPRVATCGNQLRRIQHEG
jgi:hypothetical protein